MLYILLLCAYIQYPSILCFRQLKWLVKNQDRLETLVSISTDGNVLEWSFKKGIVVSQLMQLKRAGVVSERCML
jgi:hypothetical protein